MTITETLKTARDIVVDKARTAHQFNDAWVVGALPYVTQQLHDAVKFAQNHEGDDTLIAQLQPELLMAERIIKAVKDADLSDGE